MNDTSMSCAIFPNLSFSRAKLDISVGKKILIRWLCDTFKNNTKQKTIKCLAQSMVNILSTVEMKDIVTVLLWKCQYLI